MKNKHKQKHISTQNQKGKSKTNTKTIVASDRKALRKEKRKSKKRNRGRALENTSNLSKRLPKNDSMDDDDNDNDHDHGKEVNEKKYVKREKKKQKLNTAISDEVDDELEDNDDPYIGLDPMTASALRNDDAEIKFLESKLGLSGDSKAKMKLKKEYAKLEGFGDDFGDFLDDLDGIVGDVLFDDNQNRNYKTADNDGNDDNDDQYWDENDEEMIETSDGEEEVPMKEGSPIRDDSSLDLENTSDDGDESGSENDEDEDEDEDDDEEKSYLDTKEFSSSDIYQPTKGEDIYGKRIDSQNDTDKKVAKYIPPHLRNKENKSETDKNIEGNIADGDQLNENHPRFKHMNQSVKGLLNRLSDSNLESTLQKMLELYRDPTNSTNALNQIICHTLFDSYLTSKKQLLLQLIPVNACLIAGLHYSLGKNVSAHVLEHLVLKYISMKHDRIATSITDNDSLHDFNQNDDDIDVGSNDKSTQRELYSKAGSNLILFLCYLYNLHIVHCTLMYDIIRTLIQSFKEIDVEVLLLIFNHAGNELRNDDPSSLKDIVYLAKERAFSVLGSKHEKVNSQSDDPIEGKMNQSRIQFMMEAMNDLKNNNSKRSSIRGKQLMYLGEKVKNYRKILGRVKSNNVSRGFLSSGGSDGSCLRISLQDIIDIPTKGRWWKTGASWIGNQHHNTNGNTSSSKSEDLEQSSNVKKSESNKNENHSKLLRLANQARMNTDLRKTIFCIILTSSDCDDAFTNLVRQQIATSHYPEIGSVLVECCVREKTYNPFYAHLGLRLCEFKKKYKRALGKTISDFVKRLYENEEMDEHSHSNAGTTRHAANLGKLSSHWLREGVIKLMVIEGILLENDALSIQDPDSPTVIFLIFFFQTLLSSIEYKETVQQIFSPRKFPKQLDEDQGMEYRERDEELRKSVLAFMMKYLVKSPKNTNGSTFQKNLKVAMKCCKLESMDF